VTETPLSNFRDPLVIFERVLKMVVMEKDDIDFSRRLLIGVIDIADDHLENLAYERIKKVDEVDVPGYDILCCIHEHQFYALAPLMPHRCKILLGYC